MDAPTDALGFVLLVAPGLLFELGLARSLSYLRRPLADRVTRFASWSLLWHCLLLPASVVVLMIKPHRLADATFVQAGLLSTWGFAIVLVPWLLGVLLGPHAKNSSTLGDVVLGRDPAPLAWHHLHESFDSHEVWLRLKFKGGRWVAGRWAYSSDEPEDILLSPRVECDVQTGEITLADGRVVSADWQLLVRVSDLERIEAQIIEPPKEQSNG